MVNQRPDPDELLARIKETEAQQKRGKLKIFFGAAAGVGKTYAMLDAAHLRKAEGIDVIIGYVEPHPRPETLALMEGLEAIPPQVIEYKGTQLREFDLDAALKRRPQLILIDELAHTNAPGTRHPKRWQDVEELLAAGIDVYTTVNVQHLESFNDVVSQVTGVVVHETVPDSIVEKADDLELVDIPPDELLKRFQEGKVYRLDQAQKAMQNFFRKGNLMALRELALRRTAERVDEQMQAYKRAHAIEKVWSAGERILVCVSPSPLSMRLVRAAKRMASSLHAEWLAVFVETPHSANLPDQARTQIFETLRLAENLGAETAILTGQHVSQEIVNFARARNVTKIVVGKPVHSVWRDVIKGSVLNELVRESGEIDVHVISSQEEEDVDRAPRRILPRPTSKTPAYFNAVAIVVLTTLISGAMFPYISNVNLAFVYLVGVVFVAARFGRGPSILASFLSVAAFDFFFVTPYLTFAVSDTQYVLTFFVMLVVALTISSITVQMKQQAELARQRERRTASLYDLSREFARNLGTENLVKIAAQHISQIFDAQVVLMLPDANRELIIHASENFTTVQNVHEQGVAQWVFTYQKPAGVGTETLSGSKGLYLPLITSNGIAGVLGIYPKDRHQFDSPEQLHLLETFTNQTALAIERTRLAAESEQIRMQIEAERMRNSLLSSVSHDLRTPLASITGASTSLMQSDPQIAPEERQELYHIIYEEADRLNRLVGNLLDMTRLESGGIQVDKEWNILEEVIGSALTRLRRQISHYRLVTRLPDDLPLIPMDSILIEQVVSNLVENAMKYSPLGSEILIEAIAAPDQIMISVADQGTGIPAGSEEKVFEKFYRGPQQDVHGVGLGLTICRSIIELHGGQIWAENRSGGGSIFSFTLPLEGKSPEVNTDE